MFDIPDNVEISRGLPRTPKGWGYSLQSSDIFGVLGDLFAETKLQTMIWYSNEINESHMNFGHLVSINYRGSHNKYLRQESGPKWNRISLDVYAIKSCFRKDTRELLKRDVLPFVETWLRDKIKADVQSDGTLLVQYSKSWNANYSEKYGRVSILEKCGRQTILGQERKILQEFKHSMELENG